MEVGDKMDSWASGDIVGLTGNVKFTSLREGESNIGFVTGKLPYPLTTSYIRLKAGADVDATVSHIYKTLADIDPAYPVEIGSFSHFIGRIKVTPLFYRDSHHTQEICGNKDHKEVEIIFLDRTAVRTVTILRTDLLQRKSHIFDTGKFLQAINIGLMRFNIQVTAQRNDRDLIFVKSQRITTHIFILQMNKTSTDN